MPQNSRLSDGTPFVSPVCQARASSWFTMFGGIIQKRSWTSSSQQLARVRTQCKPQKYQGRIRKQTQSNQEGLIKKCPTHRFGPVHSMNATHILNCLWFLFCLNIHTRSCRMSYQGSSGYKLVFFRLLGTAALCQYVSWIYEDLETEQVSLFCGCLLVKSVYTWNKLLVRCSFYR